MQELKVSQYNYFFDSEDETHLAFNALSGAFATITDEKYRMVQDILAHPNTYRFDTKEKTELREKMIRGGFLINKSISEIDIVKMRYRTGKYANNSFGLTIAPTMNCNFNCIYCYEQYQKGTMNSKVIEALVFFVREKIKNVKHFSVTWFGGEPLLAFDIIKKLTEEFKKLCEINHCIYHADMITNGYLLSEEVARELEKLEVSSVQITVDGPPEIHDRRRMLKNGKGTFDVIWKNLKNLANLKSIHTVLRVNADLTNKTGVFKFLDFFDKEGLKEKIPVYIGRVQDINNCANYGGQCTALASKEFCDFDFEVSKEMLRRDFRFFGVPGPRSSRCVGDSMTGFVVGPTGHLYKCWNHVGNIEESVGFLRPDGFSSNEKLAQWFFWEPFNSKACLNCKLLPVCMGSCPYKSLANKNPGACCDDEWKFGLIKRLKIYYEFKKIHPEKQEWEK